MTTPNYWDKAVKFLSAKDKVLKSIIEKYPDARLHTRGSAYHTLIRSIVGQQISVKAADSVWARLTRNTDTIIRADILQLTDEDLRVCGLSGQKVRYIREVTEFFATTPDFNAMDDETAIKTLTGIKGIGRWSAEMFLIFHLLRPDVLPLGDIGLQKAMFKFYFGGEKVSLPELEAYAERWRPYRTVATWYLWRALDPVVVAY